MKSTPGTDALLRMSMATHVPLALLRADALGRDLAPAAGRGAEIDHARAGLAEMELVVDLDQLVGRA